MKKIMKLLKKAIIAYKYCFAQDKKDDAFWVGAAGVLMLVMLAIYAVARLFLQPYPFDVEDLAIGTLLLIMALCPVMTDKNN